MNSKKNSFKRVAAGALAVLTVAAYTTPVANVAGLPSVNVLTAEAADETVKLTLDEAAFNYVTSIKDGANTSLAEAQIKGSEIALANLKIGNTATIKSTVPMKFKTSDGVLTKEANAFTETVSGGIYTYKFKVPGKAVSAELYYEEANVVFDEDSSTSVKKAGVTVESTYLGSLPFDDDYATDEIVVGETVKITSEAPFSVEVDANPDDIYSDAQYPSTKFADGKFYVEFKMPQPKGGVKNTTQFLISDLEEEYTYKVSGAKLLASTESQTIVNAEVASLDIKAYDKVAEIGDANKGTTVANNAQIANGKFLVITPSEANDFVEIKSFELKHAGIVVADDVEDLDDYYISAGSYVATFVLTGKDKKDYTITRSFSIAAKEALSAADVKLDFTVFNADGAPEVETEGVKGKVGGIAEITLDEEATEVADEFTVDAYFDGLNLVEGTDYDITGSKSGSTLDKIYTITVKVYNPEYGGSKTSPKTFKVQWRINSYGSQPVFNDSVKFNHPVEGISTLKSTINKAVAANDAATKAASSLTYCYVKGYGADEGVEELDDVIKGLPTSAGKYTVYVSYNNEEVSRVQLNITANSAYYTIDSSALKITYGDAIDFTKFTLKDKDGKVISDAEVDNLTFLLTPTLDADGDGKADKNEDGTYKAGGPSIQVQAKSLNRVNAGYYFVKLSGGTIKGNYTLVGKEQIFKVAKKAVTADMVLIDPIEYDGETHNIVDQPAYAYDPATGAEIKVKVTEGTQESEIGTYTATVKLDSADPNPNYSCSVKAKWSIIPEFTVDGDADYDNYYTGLAWDDDMTTLYDNGRIHVELKRGVNSKIKVNGNKAIVKQFGVVYNKDGKYKAPEEYDKPSAKEIANVERSLLIGNNGALVGGYTEKTDVKASTATRYKANFKVKDAETGIWARSYLIVEDSVTKETMIVYGDTKYINLEKEAINILNVQMPIADDGLAVRRADLEDVEPGDPQIKGGYNPFTGKYYTYASFNDLEDKGFSDLLEVADFGVIADKSAQSYTAFIESGNVAFDDEGEAFEAFIDEYLRLGVDGLTVGHYDKKNSHLGANEYAANISPVNQSVPVIVRPYVDLGNGLVIYGDIAQIPTASIVFNDDNDILDEVKAEYNEDKNIYTLTVDEPDVPEITRPDGKNAVVELIQYGVVAEKNGKYGTEESIMAGGFLAYYKAIMAVMTDLDIDHASIIGKTKPGTDEKYQGKVTPNGDNLVWARSYAIYKVDGQKMVIYGDAFAPFTKHIAELD